jgi:hypothetical protein
MPQPRRKLLMLYLATARYWMKFLGVVSEMRRLLLRLLICACVVIASFFVSLDIVDYFNASSGTNCAAGASCCPNGQASDLSRPFSQLEVGYGYKVSIPQLSGVADTERGLVSQTVVCEGDNRMGPAHTPIVEIVQKGGGRFIHYDEDVFFSSSDNTDPNSNGRQYRIVIPSPTGWRCRGFAFLLAFC